MDIIEESSSLVGRGFFYFPKKISKFTNSFRRIEYGKELHKKGDTRVQSN